MKKTGSSAKDSTFGAPKPLAGQPGYKYFIVFVNIFYLLRLFLGCPFHNSWTKKLKKWNPGLPFCKID
jgi:hypothetical protein